MPPTTSPFPTPIKALTFDVFGTTVDCITSITDAFTTATKTKLATPSSPPPAPSSTSSPPSPQPAHARLDSLTRLQTLTPTDWTRFAEQWTTAYNAFTRAFVPGETAWKDIDTHHHESLRALLDEWQLAGVYTDEEVAELSKVWHFLTPWPDSAPGLERLAKGGIVTASLSNGNHALLEDLDKHGGLGFRRLISAEDFKMYKPRPEVYLGACKLLGFEPGEVAMVAAHLGDLEAARKVGLRTVYVERPGEEEWGSDEPRYLEAREWVDVWVAEGEGGFEEVARRLGV